MALTQLADIIEPDVFTDYEREIAPELFELFQSGAVRRDMQMDGFAAGGGRSVHLPFWQDLSGASELDDDDPSSPATPAKRTAAEDVAVKHFRRRAWGFADLAGDVAGSDPQGDLATRVATYWNRRYQNDILIPTLQGMLTDSSGPLLSTHVLAKHSEDYDNAGSEANLINFDNVLETVGLLGDAWARITGIAVHGTVFNRLQRLNLIEYEQPAGQDIRLARIQDKLVLVDDNMPSRAGTTSGTVYTTFFFAEASVAWGEGSPKVPVETDRDGLGSTEYLISRRHCILHPRGVSWTPATGVPAGVSPSTAEMQDGGNWTKVWEDKNIGVLALTTNG